MPATDPDAPRARIELDPALVNRDAPLRQISEGHFAAVYKPCRRRRCSRSARRNPHSVDAVRSLDTYLVEYEPQLSNLVADERMPQEARHARFERSDQIESEVAFIGLPASRWLGFRRVMRSTARPVGPVERR